MHPERQGHRLDRAKKTYLGHCGNVTPSRCHFDRNFVERTIDNERRPGQGFL
jgi:hypothetical protein